MAKKTDGPKSAVRRLVEMAENAIEDHAYSQRDKAGSTAQQAWLRLQLGDRPEDIAREMSERSSSGKTYSPEFATMLAASYEDCKAKVLLPKSSTKRTQRRVSEASKLSNEVLA